VKHILQKNNVTYLVGNNSIINRSLEPYDSLLCEFFENLSSELRSSKEAKTYPDVIAFAFWCRKANIIKLKRNYEDGKARLGKGLVFHITPSNVPVNFAFSFSFGLISGNANIVRVPSKHFPQIEIICTAINRVFENDKYRDIKAMTAFLRYEQNDKITSNFSGICNSRIIWGGDEAIRDIRKLPLPERSVELVFADRYSLCVIDAPSVIKIDKSELKRLANNFFNDTYLMDQNACSSPHLIVWQGNKKEVAKELFWTAVSSIVAEKYQLADINAVEKYTLLCQNAIELDNINYVKKYGNDVYRVVLSKLQDDMEKFRGKYGYFYEYDSEDLNHLSAIINNKFQTLTYFGVDKSELLDFVLKNHLPGIDRIVPIGQALEMGVVWDGYDIVKILSRIVDIK